MKGQGATEYLVLLAVVLVIALVGIALLGFFPGTANDAQLAESEIYWESANPIAITERMSAFYSTTNYPFFRLKNAGTYAIRIVALIGSDGGRATQVYAIGGPSSCAPTGSVVNMSDILYLAPGEEKTIGSNIYGGGVCNREIWASTSGASSGRSIIMNSVCQNSSSSPGTMIGRGFGFEYIQYVEGQEILKRQIGTKPLIVKCREPF